jgi:hypothetical protein
MAKNAKTKGKRGRPPMPPNEVKRASFNTRLRTALKNELERAASDSGRSLSEEIEFRLERSFHTQAGLREMLELRFGPELARILDIVGRDAAAEIRKATGGELDVHANWIDNEKAFGAAREAVENVLALFDPRPQSQRPRQSWGLAADRSGANDIGGYGEWLRQGLAPHTVERTIARGRGIEAEEGGR